MIKQALKNRWQNWIERRIPASKEVVLSQRSIFILPSKTGWMFALLLLLLLVTAINYQNSMIYALVFWLFAIALSAMIFTYRNLSGLKIKTSYGVKGYVGEKVEIPLRISSDKGKRQGLIFNWNKKDSTDKNSSEKESLNSTSSAASAEGEREVLIEYQLNQRGLLQTPRLKLQTRYPFGLYTSWTWLRLQAPGIIYPKPIISAFVAAEGEGDVSTDANLLVGNDEFLGLRSYQPGDSLKHIAWKYLAKGKGLLTKEYDNQQLSMQWLDWSSLPGMGIEERLSHLTGWVLQAEQEGRAYGLRLPNIKILPNQGDAHRDECLKALALYNLMEPANVG
jgi:uncharacterized protein (DUF58 family)